MQYSSFVQGEEEEVLEARVAFEEEPRPVGDDDGGLPVPSADNPPEVRPSLIEEARPLSSTRSADDEFDLRIDLTSQCYCVCVCVCACVRA